MTSAASAPPTAPVAAPPSPAGWPRLSPGHLLVAAFWGAFFYVLNSAALHAPDLWGHAACGRWIIDHRALPQDDPVAPLAGGELVNSAWLSQVVFAALAPRGGGEGFSALFALVTLAAFALLARAFYVQSRSLFVAHGGVLAVAALSWSRTGSAHPEMFGTLCFAALLWLLVRDREKGDREKGVRNHFPAKWFLTPFSRWESWFGIPVLMVLWANLHGSFTLGLLALACGLVGTMVEVAWRERAGWAVVSDPAVRRWVWLTELAVAASCLNPYGARLLLHLTWFANYTQLAELDDFKPLVMLEAGGREVLASLFVIMLFFRRSGRRIPVADALLLVAFAVVAADGSRFAWWYAAVFGVVAVPHAAGWWAQRRTRCAGPQAAAGDAAGRRWFGLKPGPSVAYSLVALLVLWIAFTLSPASTFVGSRDPRPSAGLYGAAAPWGLSRHLAEHPPAGQVFNPHWWGDWLTWDGPRGLSVFMTTNMHLVPASVWTDYRIVRETRSGWEKVLDRYGVETVIVDKRRQRTLLYYLRDSKAWHSAYEDDHGVIFHRGEKP